MDHCDDEQAPLAVLTDVHQVALVGNPNAGKTTLFNALTGLRAKTANYPGVTVTRREALVDLGGERVRLVDLPGSYGFVAVSPDEQVVTDALHGRIAGVTPPEAVMVVADATTLERSLLLLGEVLELDRPTALVLTMIDEVAARGGSIDLARLSDALGVPVLGVVGHRGIGLADVRELLADPQAWRRAETRPALEPTALAAWIDDVLGASVSQPGPDRRSYRIDDVLLHPIWGVAAFVAVMLGFFQTIFTLAAPLADRVDTSIVWLVDQTREAVPGFGGELLADGVIGGVGAVLVFLPQIVLLFLMLALLEKVGYLARAAFLADRVMGRFGLEGRSFVSMLSSFACAIPGIMSTRTISSERRRLATMMAAPLMTCSARLPVFTLLIAAFVPDQSVLGPIRSQGLVMFGLYLLGGLSGLLYAAALNAFAIHGAAAPVVMELPPYRRPTGRSVLLATWDAAHSFIRKAGTIILASSVALWLLLQVPSVGAPENLSEAEQASYEMERSIAGYAGKALEPVFAPLGFEWRTNVALIGSLAAREVFVSTLALTTAAEDEDSLPDRLAGLTDEDGQKVFDAPTVAALLVFFVYALQCISTIAVLRRETNSRRWPAIAFTSMFALAYAGALLARWVTDAIA